ncbi:hypothetical protein GYMLUDRAFT_294881 [Collybiopsis luxurians FD-317 M1]|nr:hypothetical protein GYMLUDRAFT_294881 [Collybiopsis luxurians FD-317 M1]
MEQEESQPVAEDKPLAEVSEPSEAMRDQEESKPPSPRPQLTMSTESTMEDTADTGDVLDASLKPLDTSGIGEEKLSTETGMDLDLELGPGGLALSGVQSLEDGDHLLGGPNMDNTMDPFAAPDAEITDKS